ncbi:MAG TPA: DUF6056 family protein [Kofleriaceae bacterium]
MPKWVRGLLCAIAMTGRGARFSFAGVLAGLFGLFAVCAAWEPIQRDGWFHYAWYRDHDLTAGAIWSFFEGNYLHGNPRLGEVVTFLSYAPGVHVITTPLCIVGTVVAVAALVLGRWPSPSRPEHVTILVLVCGMIVISAPGAGELFCYRPVVGNYVFGFVPVLGLLLPYRMHAVTPRRRGWVFAIALFGLGMLAGMTNEHTGPVAIGMLATVLWWFRRRGSRWAPWMVSGLVGLAIGCALLLLAPGQTRRYTGLAAEQSILERVLARDVADTLLVFGFGAAAAALVLPWILVGIVARSPRDPDPPPLVDPQRAWLWILALGGLAVLVVLLGSPKQGWRLVYAPALLWMCAGAIWLRPRLTGRTRTLMVALALTGLGIQAIQLLRVQHRLKAEAADRMTRLRATPAGAILTLPSHSLGRSPWFQGDELDSRAWRVVIARTFGLAMVSPIPGPGAPALVLEHDSPLPDPPLVATRIAPAAFAEMRQACVALARALGEPPGNAAYRLDALDAGALGGRPIRACAHRAGATIAPIVWIERVGRRTWRLLVELDAWQPAGSIEVHAITPGWTTRAVAANPDGTYRLAADGPRRHHIVVCDPVECFLAGSVGH